MEIIKGTTGSGSSMKAILWALLKSAEREHVIYITNEDTEEDIANKILHIQRMFKLDIYTLATIIEHIESISLMGDITDRALEIINTKEADFYIVDKIDERDNSKFTGIKNVLLINQLSADWY